MENYEYEMPSDFEDEEIDEDLAFTAEDKKKYAGWFGEEADDAAAGAGSSGDEQQQQGSKKRARGEFADLDSSEEEEPEEDEVGGGSVLVHAAMQAAWQGSSAKPCELVGASVLWCRQQCKLHGAAVLLGIIVLQCYVHLLHTQAAS